MSLNLQPGEGALEDGHLADIDNNTTLLLELIRLTRRANYLLAAINVQLGKNGGSGPTRLAEVIDQENNEEIY